MSMRWQPAKYKVAEVTVGYANRDRVYKWKQSVQMVTESSSLGWAATLRAIFSYGQVNELGRQLLA